MSTPCPHRACAALLLGVLVAVQSFGQMPQRTSPGKEKTKRLLVQFKAGARSEAVEDAGRQGRLKPLKKIHTSPMKEHKLKELIVAETDRDVDAVVTELQKHPAVEFAEPDYIRRHHGPGDPYVSGGQLWGVYGQDTTPANTFGTGVSRAWAAGFTGGAQVCVGVLDEGVFWTHEDLQANIWTNPREVPGDGIDNDGNGYADDVHGWNFYNYNGSVYVAGGDEHGTHVAGTIAAVGDNGRGLAGINWKAAIIPAKFMGPDGGYTSDAVEAIDYYIDLKARHGLNLVAINNSWGGGGRSRALQEAIIRAAKAGILFVVAAGNGDASYRGINNDSIPDYPANYDSRVGTYTVSGASYNAVISVAAIDKTGALAGFSNYGAQTVHLGAPGVEIWSTVPDHKYAPYNGTSMAAPHVTGGIALYASTHPGQSADQIRNAVLAGVASTPALIGKTVTGGRLNLSRIIEQGASTPSFARPILKLVRQLGNQVQLGITGPKGQVLEFQTSADLRSWISIGVTTNTTGVVQVTEAVPVARRFYRAIAR